MSSLPPKIDQRSYDDLVRQTAVLISSTDTKAEGKSKWLFPSEEREVDLKGSGLVLKELVGSVLTRNFVVNDETFEQGRIVDRELVDQLRKTIESKELKSIWVKNVKPDPGWALIRIFSRMAALVSDRLNQVPEKNFLAFLDLLGGQLNPPQPARVPLTFYLAEGSTSEAVVPLHTQVSAPPAQENAEEVVFETDQELVVTTAQLQAVYVKQPDQDKYQDCTLAATGKTDAAFLVFEGNRAIEHILYVSCEEIFKLNNLENITLTFQTATKNNADLYNDLPITWAYWEDQTWKTLEVTKSTNDVNWIVTLPKIPPLTPCGINGKQRRWLRASLSNVADTSPAIASIEGRVKISKTSQPSLVPESCLSNFAPVDLSKAIYPFGTEPNLNDTFYILLHEALIKPNVTITLNLTQSSTITASSDLKISWEYGDGQEWKEIVGAVAEIKFTETSYSKSFTLASVPTKSTVNGTTGYWIRARITQGFYGQQPKPRVYVILNEVAAINSSSIDATDANNEKPKLEIAGRAEDLFKPGDQLRLVWNDINGEKIQEREIETATGNTITLKRISTDRPRSTSLAIVPSSVPASSAPPFPSGTRILLKSIVSETSLPIYDPPLIQSKSLTLDYEFTLNEPAVCLAYNDFTYIYNDFTQKSTITQAFHPFIQLSDREPTLYLGFSQPERLVQQGIPPFSNKPVTLYAEVDPPSPEDALADSTTPVRLVWEYSSPTGWSPLPGVQDGTQAFFQPGLIQFIGPPDLSQQLQFGQNLYWLRVRWEAGNFRIKPRLRQLLTNTTWAVQAITLREEVLGSSNGDRNQIFFTSQIPVLEGQQLEVHEERLLTEQLETIELDWRTWQEVPDFYGSQATDRHYVLDRQTGKVEFGDGQSGLIPPRGINNIRMAAYRTGGGTGGNRAAQTIIQLKTTIPYVDRVINLAAAGGGAEQEDLEHLKDRVPKQLRHRDRAVTKQDFEDLAYAASTQVARVKVISPEDTAALFNPLDSANWLNPKTGQPLQGNGKKRQATPDTYGQIKVIVVPQSQGRQPISSLALLNQVETYLRDRCEPGVTLTVVGPRWVEVSVTAQIAPRSLDQTDVVRTQVIQKLDSFLHPLSGGQGNGWAFGRYPHESDLYAQIQSVLGVDHVLDVKLKFSPAIDSTPQESHLDADSFIYSGSHTVTVSGLRGN